MKFTHYILILLSIIIHSCNYDSQKNDNNTVINNSSGWWIYGEGLHLYKDEISLEENIIHSCNYDSQKKDNDIVINTSSGWWIYGEGLHLYKDEISLEENIIHFLNEDSLNLIELYMSVTEMEYFPLEVDIKFENKKDSLLVHDFDITYIQGCDEQ